jgi:hypothetical protein
VVGAIVRQALAEQLGRGGLVVVLHPRVRVQKHVATRASPSSPSPSSSSPRVRLAIPEEGRHEEGEGALVVSVSSVAPQVRREEERREEKRRRGEGRRGEEERREGEERGKASK